MKSLTVRYSELSALAECQLKYQLGYAAGLIGEPKPRLALGSAFHALMQGHYEAFALSDAAFEPRDLTQARARAGRRLAEYRLDTAGGGRHVNDEMLDQLRWMYGGFVELYGTDDDYDEIRSVEQRRTVPLVSHLGVRVNLAVTADLIVHHKVYDRIILVDHKTASGRDAGKMAMSKDNQLDPQRGTYAASYTLFGPKKDRLPIFGTLHNTIRTDQLKRPMLLEERFGRGPVYYGEKELRAIWTETQNLARDAVEIRLGRGRAKRMYSSPDPDRCSWKCQFKEVHLTSRATGRDPVQVALDYGFKVAGEDNPFIGTVEEVPK